MQRRSLKSRRGKYSALICCDQKSRSAPLKFALEILRALFAIIKFRLRLRNINVSMCAVFHCSHSFVKAELELGFALAL